MASATSILAAQAREVPRPAAPGDPYAIDPRKQAGYEAPLPPPKVRPRKFDANVVNEDVDGTVLGVDEIFGGSLGTAFQLRGVGPHNYVLDLNPEITFFKLTHKHHTPGATEAFEDGVDLVFGQTAVVEIQRRGDVLGDVFLSIDVPNLGLPGGRWADALGYVLLTRVRLLIDDVVVHDQERLWYDIADRVLHAQGADVDAMIGRGATLPTDRAHSLLVPLKFVKNLPLAALKRTARVVLEVGVEALGACVVGVQPPPSAPRSMRARVVSDQSYVSDEERRQLMSRRHELVVFQQQDADALGYQFDDVGTYAVGSAAIELRELNLPVKLLAFVAYDETAASRGRYFDYLDCLGDVSLLLGSTQRFQERPGEYFSLVQTYSHAARCLADNVHVYSFALDAAAAQHSGALNFAVVQKPTLRAGLRNLGSRPIKVKAFAHCINWLVLDKGSASLRFT